MPSHLWCSAWEARLQLSVRVGSMLGLDYIFMNIQQEVDGQQESDGIGNRQWELSSLPLSLSLSYQHFHFTVIQN